MTFANRAVALLAACSLTAGLSGCASSGGAVKAAFAAVTPLDALALGAGAYFAWTLTSAPAWSAKASLNGEYWQIDLERSPFATSGAGAGSFAFSQAAQELCRKQGAPRYQTQSFIEFHDPMILGDRQKARGVIRCQSEKDSDGA